MRQNNTALRHKYAQIIAQKLDKYKEILRQQLVKLLI
jgi:hypothetical protein